LGAASKVSFEVSCVWPLPSAFMTQISGGASGPPSFASNAILCPSGDQSELRARPGNVCVSWVSTPPSSLKIS
jgi:hypothetical protein